MNYNDQIQNQQGLVLHTDEDQYDQHSHDAQQYNKNLFRGKGKQNSFDPNNQQVNYKRAINNVSQKGQPLSSIPTNHSFNSLFNQSQPKKSVAHQAVHLKSFASSSKFSNLLLVSESNQQQSQPYEIHNETRQLLRKYFPDNFQQEQYLGYIDVRDLAEILIQDYQHVIGNNHKLNITQHFLNHLILIFGDKVYFDDLFSKTEQNGLLGLIFDIFKSIEEDQKHKQSAKISHVGLTSKTIQNNSRIKANQSIIGKNNMQSTQSRLTLDNSMNVPLSNKVANKPISTKISLDRFFSNNTSSNFSKNNLFANESQMNQQNVSEIKQILEDYITEMYEQAQHKLNKKYTHEYKKITLKYKETEKILEKVNEKICNHYDAIQTEMQIKRKNQQFQQKLAQCETKIKTLEAQVKDHQQQKLTQSQNNTKMTNQIQKLQQKLEKYQNAIFDKAMQRNTSASNVLEKSSLRANSQLITENSPVLAGYRESRVEKPCFQFKIDTFTEHSRMTPISIGPSPVAIRSYSPYVPQPCQMNRGSVSPIRQRISFNKTGNPVHNDLKISSVQKVQIGEATSLRPLSPIGKLAPINISYSPINVQYATSRVVNNTPLRR